MCGPASTDQAMPALAQLARSGSVDSRVLPERDDLGRGGQGAVETLAPRSVVSTRRRASNSG